MKGRAKARCPGCSMSAVLTALLTLLLTLFPCLASAHPGGRDSHDGHRVSSTGRYHFHEGPLAGQEFDSKEAALRVLNAKLREAKWFGRAVVREGGGWFCLRSRRAVVLL